MSWLRLDLTQGRTAYRPGEEVTGSVSWSIGFTAEAAGTVEVHLLWFTRGKGEMESEVVASERFGAGSSRSDHRDFRLRLPAGPYSVRGELVSIAWSVEAVLDPDGQTERIGIVVSPTGRELTLHPDPPAAGAAIDPA